MKNTILLLSVILMACQKPGTQEARVAVYDEQYRSQYHFSPLSSWMNDPNGLVYHDGEYHLFYQHYPDSTVWGPMHWGHAVSTDLIHWKHLPIALYPDSLGFIFSGSAVVDRYNTSGFGVEGYPPLVALFTYHDPKGDKLGVDDFQSQALAYSNDRGRSWIKYSGNPVLENPGIRDFRDPKVVWHDDSRQWVMSLAAKDHINIYVSPNLKDWEQVSEFGQGIGSHKGVWECPDLFPIEDERGNSKWVMLVSVFAGGPNGGSATQYFVGNFDGRRFLAEDSLTRWIDYGTDNYAGVTWSNIPTSDGRRISIGWMNNWQYANVIPTKGWRGAMTLPRELKLVGRQLKSWPVHELDALRRTKVSMNAIDSISLSSDLLELNLRTNDGAVGDLELVFTNGAGDELKVGFSSSRMYVDRTNAGDNAFSATFPRQITALLDAPLRHMRIYLDRSSLEVFVDEGRIVLTSRVFPRESLNKLYVRGDKGMIADLSGYVLNSIYTQTSE